MSSDLIIFDQNSEIDENNFYNLDSKWTVWYHELNDKNWSKKSYKKKYIFNDLKSFILNYEKSRLINNGFLFIMRNDIFPCWEDPTNINGGCWTFKIDRRKLVETWYFLTMTLIGNTICNTPEDCKDINGLSVTIKEFNCIIKIWNKTAEKNSLNLLTKNIINLDYSGFRYKKHN